MGGNIIKKEHAAVIVASAIGLLLLSSDAALDPAFSPVRIFSGPVIADMPLNRLFTRLLVFAGLIASGMMFSRLIVRQGQLQGLIERAKLEWEETFDIINDAITIHDTDFNIIRANRAATEMLGAPFRDILNRKCYRSYHGTGYPPETCPSCRTLATGVPSVTETFEASLNKHLEIKALPRFDSSNRIVGVVHVVRDISARVDAEAQLRSLSLTDDLTGLYNRRGFMTLSEQQLKLASRMKKGCYLLFADLDGLKQINDSLGHAEGCHALIETSVILKECFRESDILSRIGGDEFVVLSTENSSDGGPEVISGRLQRKLDEFNGRGSRRYRLSLSMGIVYCGPEDRCSISDMLNEADQLMYEQKRIRKSMHGAK
ncbi:MAG: GGDEF domain-containing protein [Thermodesulfovibrionales bacterium]